MDIAVKQRILGGVVLVAAAILFLPVVLEGAGVKALQPPAPPIPPTTPTTQDLAPALQQQAQGLAKDISASHGEPTFYPVEPAATDEVAAAPTPTPTNADDKLAEQQLAANQAAQQAARLKAQAAAETAAQAKRDNASAEKPQAADAKTAAVKAAQKLAADKKALADKALADKALADKALAGKTAAEKVAAAKLANEKLTSDKKAASEKAAVEKAVPEKAAAEKPAAAPVPSVDPDPALPQAWVVQVARVNAQDKANTLADRLRARGYRATVSGNGDSWRVIIGPELDRTVAESVKHRLAEDPQLKLSGWIQAYRP